MASAIVATRSAASICESACKSRFKALTAIEALPEPSSAAPSRSFKVPRDSSKPSKPPSRAAICKAVKELYDVLRELASFDCESIKSIPLFVIDASEYAAPNAAAETIARPALVYWPAAFISSSTFLRHFADSRPALSRPCVNPAILAIKSIVSVPRDLLIFFAHVDYPLV